MINVNVLINASNNLLGLEIDHKIQEKDKFSQGRSLKNATCMTYNKLNCLLFCEI